MTDKTREAFEVWAERQGVSLKRVSERENATYTNYETYLAYHAWQDATKVQDARVRRLEEALEHIVRRLQMDIDDGGRPDQWSMEDLVRKANSAMTKDPS